MPHSVIAQKLIDNGFDTYYVGGYVRDLILKVESSDVDIATAATPEQVESVLGLTHDIKFVGESFGVTLVDGIEVATFRRDIHNGIGDKNCEVEYTTSILEDLSRRDFTINAMAMNPITEEIIDPFGGVGDIIFGVVKFVGSPEKRILEDPNRLIRASRMLGKLATGAMIATSTFNAIRITSPEIIAQIAPERIRLEIMKAMSLKKPSVFWNALRETGMLQYILPELERGYKHPHGKHHIEDVWEHNMMAGDGISPKSPLLRLAGYLHDIGKPQTWKDEKFINHHYAGEKIIRRDLKRLKFSTDEINYVANLAAVHMRTLVEGVTPKAMRRTMCEFRKRNVCVNDFLRIRIADNNANLNRQKLKYTDIKKLIEMFDEVMTEGNAAFNIRGLAINGDVVMKETGIRSGPAVGKILKALFDLVQINPKANERQTLIYVARLCCAK